MKNTVMILYSYELFFFFFLLLFSNKEVTHVMENCLLWKKNNTFARESLKVTAKWKMCSIAAEKLFFILAQENGCLNTLLRHYDFPNVFFFFFWWRRDRVWIRGINDNWYFFSLQLFFFCLSTRHLYLISKAVSQSIYLI